LEVKFLNRHGKRFLLDGTSDVAPVPDSPFAGRPAARKCRLRPGLSGGRVRPAGTRPRRAAVPAPVDRPPSAPPSGPRRC